MGVFEYRKSLEKRKELYREIIYKIFFVSLEKIYKMIIDPVIQRL